LLFLLVQITHCYPVWKLLPRKLAPQIVVISSKRGFQITVHPEPLVNFDRSIHLHGTRPLYRTHAESELSHPLFEVVSGWPTLASEGGGTRRRAYDQHLLAPATLADPCQEACKPATSGFFKAACPAPLESCRKNEVCFFAFTSVNERRNTYPATMSSRKKNAQNGDLGRWRKHASHGRKSGQRGRPKAHAPPWENSRTQGESSLSSTLIMCDILTT
jgi:hypothetical protein